MSDMANPSQKIDYRYVATRWSKELKTYVFAAVDIDWKSYIDEKTISWPIEQKPSEQDVKDAGIWEEDVSVTMMGKVPYFLPKVLDS